MFDSMNRSGWLAWVLATALGGAAGGQDSAFQSLADTVRKEVGLAVEKERFKAEFPLARESAQSLFQVVVQVVRGGGGGGGGGDNWRYYAGSGENEVQFEIRREGQNGLDRVSLEENRIPFRSLTLETLENGQLTCLAYTPGRGEVTYLIQRDGQPITLISVAGGKSGVVSAESVGGLYLQNRDVLSAAGSSFEQAGVGNSFGGFVAGLLAELADSLLPRETDDRPVRAILERMGSLKFKEREAATEELQRRFGEWEPLIARFAEDESLSPEVRSRLKRILDMELSPERKAARRLIREQELDSDIGLLLQAWEAARSRGEESPIAQLDQAFSKRLSELTGESPGAELATWRDWWKTQAGATEIEPAPSTPLQPKPFRLEAVRGEAERLCWLEVDATGRLGFHRKAWGDEFQGKTPQQLRDELLEFARQQNVPHGWIRASTALDGQGPEHLLFEKLAEASSRLASEKPRMFVAGRQTGGGSGRNAAFETDLIAGGLTTTEGKQGGIPFQKALLEKPEPLLRIGLVDLSTGNRMDLYQDSNRFSLLLVAPTAQALWLATETQEGFVLHDLRATGSRTITAKNYAAFVEQERASGYFADVWVPTLHAFCIQLGEAAAGKLTTPPRE